VVVVGCSRQSPDPSGRLGSATSQAAGPTEPSPPNGSWQRSAEIDQAIAVERCQAGGNPKQVYFLMRHQKPAKPMDRYGLVIVLPGGPGSAEFLPFCANVLAGIAVPDDFLVAQLVAPQWRPGDDRVVWPGHAFPDERAEFSTEAFLAAVIDDVTKKEAVDERFVFTLGWSSSGHVLYSASTRVPQVRGSVVAMSRFLPERFVEKDKLKGKVYFLYHSPEDPVCPFAEAELAVRTLTEHGAEAKLVTYKGGHGWQPFTFFGDRIKEGILWLKGRTATSS
jgi:predicted esterase